MRLISTHDLELHDFLDDENAPPYAILSHTWEKEEVTFQDMRDRHVRPEVQSMVGYEKIRQCCRQAQRDGYAWTWVDTCCIDKSSSAELSEAINSMYRWYQKASVCYAFLSDVTTLDYQCKGLVHSRWFTRGWTLQELIAPKTLTFFSRQWEALGTKIDLGENLEQATGIPQAILLNRMHVAFTSIAMRMSWAAKRQTSRVEDRAYSLLGIFDINFPLIYGEGDKAFRRLQEEIIRTEPYEHTIYAWEKFTTWIAGALPREIAGMEELGVDPRKLPLQADIEWDEELANQPLLGLLARSPADFVNSGKFVPTAEAHDLIITSKVVFKTPAFVHGGVKFHPRLLKIGSNQMVHHLKHPQIIQLRPASYIALLVEDSSITVPHNVITPMTMCNNLNWGRRAHGLIQTGPSQILSQGRVLFIAPEEQRSSRSHDSLPSDIVFRWNLRGPINVGLGYSRFHAHKEFERLTGEQVVQGRTLRPAGWVASWAFKMIDSQKFWSIALHRMPLDGRRDTHRDTGVLAFSIVRTREEGEDEAKTMDGYVWYPPLILRNRSFQDTADIAACSNVMRNPTDIWRPKADGMPAGIVICVESMWDSARLDTFNVVDFRFPDGQGDSHLTIPTAD